MKKIIINICIILLFFVISLIFTYPLITVFTTKIVGNGLDSYQYLFYQHASYLNLRNFQFPFQYNYLLRYPVGFDFSRGFDGVFFTLLAAFLRFVLNPITSYNFSVILSLTLNCYLSYLLFFKLVKSRSASFIGAIIYGFSFYTLTRGAGHPNLMIVGGFPFFIYTLIRLKENQNLIDFVLLPLSMIFIAFSSQQYALMLIIFLFINIFLVPLFLKKELDQYLDIFKKNLDKLFISFFLCSIVFFIFFTPTLKSLVQGKFENAGRENIAKENSISFKEYVLPNPFVQTFLGTLVNSDTLRSIENVVFIGFAELLLFSSFLLIIKRDKKYFFIIFNVLIFFILSLGIFSPDLNISLPLSLFNKYFPFNFIPESGRYFVIFYLFICMGIILLLKQIEKNKIISLLFFALILGERLTSNYYISPSLKAKYANIVATQPGKAVLDIPISFNEPIYNYLPILYQKNVISGNFHWSADSVNTRIFVNGKPELSRFLCSKDDSSLVGANFKNNEFIFSEERFNERLKLLLLKNDVKTIVVHKDDPYKLYDYKNCNNVWLRTSNLLSETIIVKPTKINSGIIEQKWPISRVNLRLVFPFDGIFTIGKIEMYASESTDLITTLNDKKIIIDSEKPLEVSKNSILTIKSSSIFNKGYIKLAYNYQEKSIKNLISIQNKQEFIELVKIYSDENTDVYSLTQQK